MILCFANGQNVLLCLQAPFLRFHLASSPTSTTPSFTPLNKLTGARLLSFEMPQPDRIARLLFETEDKRHLIVIAELFSKKPNLYLLNQDQEILWSLNAASSIHYRFPPPRPSLSESIQHCTSQEIEKRYQALEEQFKFEQVKNALLARLRKKIASTSTRIEGWKKELQIAQNWQKHEHTADLLKANFHLLKRGLSAVKVADWETGEELDIPLAPELFPNEQIALAYGRAKKLKKNIANLEFLLNKGACELKKLENELQMLAEASSIEQLPQKPISGAVEGKKEKPAYRQFFSTDGERILVGRNANDNHELTFRIAKGSDWWCHVADYPGSHVLIPVKKGTEPAQATIAAALQLALYFSRAKEKKEALVHLTQRKYISPIKKGAPGAVSLSRHKAVHVKLDESLLHSLLNPS